MNKNIDFVNGNTKKCLLEMTVPMIIAMFLNMAYNLVDSLWIGNLLGEQAYAALTNSTPIILILTSIGMGATNGLAILLSQVIGAKNEQKKKNIIVTSFFVSIILSVFMTIVLEIFLEPILIVLNTPTEIFDMANHGNEKSLKGLISLLEKLQHRFLMHQTEQYHGGKMEKTCLVLMS